jgi:hypothetical protein
MTYIVDNSPTVNGRNGGGVVNGRGLRHRKLTRSEAVELAADVATGRRPFVPSLHHLADNFGVSVGALGRAVKARTAAQEVNATPEEVDYVDLPIEPIEEVPGLSALMQAWYAASSDARENFLCDEIVPRIAR